MKSRINKWNYEKKKIANFPHTQNISKKKNKINKSLKGIHHN